MHTYFRVHTYIYAFNLHVYQHILPHYENINWQLLFYELFVDMIKFQFNWFTTSINTIRISLEIMYDNWSAWRIRSACTHVCVHVYVCVNVHAVSWSQLPLLAHAFIICYLHTLCMKICEDIWCNKAIMYSTLCTFDVTIAEKQQ